MSLIGRADLTALSLMTAASGSGVGARPRRRREGFARPFLAAAALGAVLAASVAASLAPMWPLLSRVLG